MPKKNLKQYLHDVVNTVDAFSAHAAHFTLKDYYVLQNKWFVERGISIIGEAIYKANNLDRKLPISNIRQIIGARHIVVHDYDLLDETRLMVIVQNSLPILKQEVQAILSNLDNQTTTL